MTDKLLFASAMLNVLQGLTLWLVIYMIYKFFKSQGMK